MSCKCHRKVMEFGYGIICESCEQKYQNYLKLTLSWSRYEITIREGRSFRSGHRCRTFNDLSDVIEMMPPQARNDAQF